MSKHFYLGDTLNVIIGKNVESDMHSIFFVKLKNHNDIIEYYYGNIGDELESPYIRFRGRWTSFGHEDVLEIRRPHEIEFLVGCLLDKSMAQKGGAGRFAKEYNSRPYQLRVMNDVGQLYVEDLGSTIYGNLIGTVTIRTHGASAVAKKFDWEDFVHSDSVSTDLVWSLARKGLVHQWAVV